VSRWPDNGRFRSAFQATAWLWFFERTRPHPMRWRAAQRELGQLVSKRKVENCRRLALMRKAGRRS
jgi:hypothetical protein